MKMSSHDGSKIPSPSLRGVQEIKDDDVLLHNHLLRVANDTHLSDTQKMIQIQAVGLAAIHERLGDMWIFVKEQR